MVNKTIKQPKNKIIRIIFVVLGIISLTLGIIGIFIPLLPTTPFLLLSTALFLRSSKKLYNWLINHKYLGKYINNYIHHKSIPKRTKITAIALLWLTILFSVFFIIEMFTIKALLLVIAIGVTFHLLSLNSIPEKC